jgi:hypothetical protein
VLLNHADSRQAHITSSDTELNTGRWWNGTDKHKKEVLEEKPVTVPPYLPQILYGLTWDRNLALCDERPVPWHIFGAKLLAQLCYVFKHTNTKRALTL